MTRQSSDERLLACFYTLSGAPNGEPSRHSFEDRVRAARAAGYTDIGLTMFDVDAAGNHGLAPQDLAAIANDHGIVIAELETLSFSAPLTAAERAAAIRMFETGEKLRSHHINVLIGQPPGTRLEVDAAVDSFATLCGLASDHGLSVAFEFMPFAVVSTVKAAADLVERAGYANGGLIVDSYHFFRGGSTLEDLAVVPKNRLIAIQLSDTTTEPAADLLVETRTARKLPGQGELPLEQFLAAIGPDSEALVGTEILADELRVLPVEEVAAVTADAALALLRRAWKSSGG